MTGSYFDHIFCTCVTSVFFSSDVRLALQYSACCSSSQIAQASTSAEMHSSDGGPDTCMNRRTLERMLAVVFFELPFCGAP